MTLRAALTATERRPCNHAEASPKGTANEKHKTASGECYVNAGSSNGSVTITLTR